MVKDVSVFVFMITDNLRITIGGSTRTGRSLHMARKKCHNYRPQPTHGTEEVQQLQTAACTWHGGSATITDHSLHMAWRKFHNYRPHPAHGTEEVPQLQTASYTWHGGSSQFQTASYIWHGGEMMSRENAYKMNTRAIDKQMDQLLLPLAKRSKF